MLELEFSPLVRACQHLKSGRAECNYGFEEGDGTVMQSDNQQDWRVRRTKVPHNITIESPSSIYSMRRRGRLLSISAIISPAAITPVIVPMGLT